MKINRKVAELTAGDYQRANRTARFEVMQTQPVKIIKFDSEDEDDDWFIIETYNGERLRVGASDLHPTPYAPQTNVEFMTELMEWGSTALVQAFVLEGAAQYAERVAKAKPEECSGNPMIHGPAWHATAVEVRDKIAEHFKK